MQILYVVSTPIGNLEDVTIRALRILGEVDLIAAEDTRVTHRLLDRYNIATPSTSYNEHNSRTKIPSLLAKLGTGDIALVSDAGMPGINDPGAELVRAAVEAGFTVLSVPGPSALTTALSVSGMNVDQFVYLGFLPKKQSARLKLLKATASETRCLLLLETPHRLRDALVDIAASLGDRELAICRELTKLHEEVFRGSASEALCHFNRPKGEFTIVVEGNKEQPVPELDQSKIRSRLSALRANGVRAKDAVPKVADETGLSKRSVYRLWLEIHS